ncbi:MAG: hypothetical protein LIR50_15570 [Bacillota bacterium]|nr:hypothetical protein [Bacillota bacterium]
MKKRYIVTIAAAIVCSFSIGGYAYYKAPVSYLSLDINPSVELGLNAFNKVVSASAYNEDGQTILEGQDVINQDVKDAVNTLVNSAAEEGFIADDGSSVISVTSETDDKEEAEELENEAEEGANEAIEESGDAAEVIKDNVALARRDEARLLGITPGKLNLIQKLQALDPSIKVEDYKDAKVKDIQKKFVELKNRTKTAGEQLTTADQEETTVTETEEVQADDADKIKNNDKTKSDNKTNNDVKKDKTDNTGIKAKGNESSKNHKKQ